MLFDNRCDGTIVKLNKDRWGMLYKSNMGVAILYSKEDVTTLIPLGAFEPGKSLSDFALRSQVIDRGFSDRCLFQLHEWETISS